MKKVLKLFVFLCFITSFSGCALYGGGRHGGGDEAVYGTTGAILGGVAGATTKNPLITAAGATGGFLLGRAIGQQRDDERAAVGVTNCESRISRTYNRDGTVGSVTQNDENCRSVRRSPGYRDGYNR